MSKVLVLIISYALGSMLLRIFAAIGIGFFTYSSLNSIIDSALGYLQSYVSAVPEAIIQILTLGGFIEGLSVVCSAMVVAASFASARVFVGTVS